MTHSEFNHILSSLGSLSPAQMRRLVQELQSKIGTSKRKPATAAKPGAKRLAAEPTAFDLANRAGLIGCIAGAARSPKDLSTNPKHMEGFGRD